MNNMSSNKPVASLTNRKTTLQIFDVPAKLGRNDNVVDVHFFHNSVSREHCLFECNSRRFTVKDLGSHAGTFINGVQLEPGIQYYIEDGDKITIGQVKFVFNADYAELGRREQSAARSGMPQNMLPEGRPAGMPMGQTQGMPQNMVSEGRPAGSSAGNVFRGPDGRKKAVVSARPLVQFEYDENEVIYIESGLGAAPKKQKYTQDITEEDIEKAFNAPEAFAEPAEGHGEEPSVYAEPAPEAAPEPEFVPEPDDYYEDEATMVIRETIYAPVRPRLVLRLRWKDEETGETGEVLADHFPFYIGRKSGENDFALLKRALSRRHMVFTEKDGAIYVYDDNSTNGVRVNGARIEPGYEIRLMEKDVISAGNVSFVVEKVGLEEV